MNQNSEPSSSKVKYLVIRHFERNAGFTALISSALNGIRLAEQQGRIPVIYFDQYMTRFFYDENLGDNVWEYFFSPLGGVSYATLKRDLMEKKIAREDIHWLTPPEAYYLRTEDPERITTFWCNPEYESANEFFRERRLQGRRLVSKYIHPHASISCVADTLFEQFRSQAKNRIFGVHIRGTDLNYAEPISPETYFAAIRAKAERDDDDSFSILLATDQIQFLEQFREEFGEDRVFSQDCLRSDNWIAAFKSNEATSLQKGSEVMIDILLLSKCDYLFKGPAAVGEAAQWFGDGMEAEDLTVATHRPLQTANTPAYLRKIDQRGLLAKLPDYISEFIERVVYAYAPIPNRQETVRRIALMGKRWIQFKRKGYHFSSRGALFQSLSPAIIDFDEGDPEFSFPEGKHPIPHLRASRELICSSGVYSDGWTQTTLELRMRPSSPGFIFIRGQCHYPVRMEVRVNLNLLEEFDHLEPGEFSLRLPVSSANQIHSIQIELKDHIQLLSPDERVVGLLLEEIWFESES